MIDKDYAHLLGRPEHTFDERAIDRELLTKNILITGAGGSIGSALTRRICQSYPSNVYVVGHGEDSIFQLVQRLHEDDDAKVTVIPVIADAYSDRVASILKGGCIDYVFHTAAHKHVGLMESNPHAALANNTQTTIWLARKCEEVGTRFVYMSTDKAVKPTTVMGASKKLAEAWVDANCKNAVTIRLGNVLGSAGSLVEIVERKAASGWTFVLSDPRMARFFVTVKEAVGLILAAGTDCMPGKYTLEMGRPQFIEALVRKIAPEIEIVTNHIRAGDEKLAEDLREDDEGYSTLGPDSPFVRLRRSVEPKLVSAVLEIIEDNANSELDSNSLSRLIVNFARKV
jgi:UDP-N-acetylglucosamine 4,6-dehydratase